MRAPDYRREDLTAALAALPLEPGDVLFCHSNLGYFGRMEGADSADTLCRAFLDQTLARVAPHGTLVVPTFTYSFPRREIFDVANTASSMGFFAEWLRRQPDAVRSSDPCYSIAAVGARAGEMARDASENSFDDHSFFGRFWNAGGKVLNFNFDAGSTFVHFVERKLQVPYRFDKRFTGSIREHGVERQATSTIWVRYLSDDSLEAAFEGLDEIARADGLFVTRRLGRGELGTISAQATFDVIRRTLPTRPWFLTKAEQLGIANPRIIPEG
jgi:aminoglycoside 3-N-acetyltransferase